MQGPKKRWLTSLLGPASGLGGDPRSAGAGASEEAGEAEVGSEAASPEERSPDEGAAPRARATSVISRKELARELRREAYQRAKRARAADPKHLAMKEVAKQRRREAYQQFKAHRKAKEAELEAQHQVARGEERTRARQQLGERVKAVIARAGNLRAANATAARPVREAKPALEANGQRPGLQLARDIEQALKNGEVRSLMERLSRDSAALAAQHRGDDRVDADGDDADGDDADGDDADGDDADGGEVSP